jgi:hypothetical protein
MFSAEYRERVWEWLVERARGDRRVVAAAAVGSSASGGDRWSDLDLAFAVADGVAVEAVLADWTRAVGDEFDGAVLFDLPVGSTIYRVFLLAGALQVDLSLAPAAEFGARGPRFRLLFGEAVEKPWAGPPSMEFEFGLAVHHAVRGQLCIERGRLWQAEYWISALRDHALTVACLRRGLETSYGRGFDALPAEVRDAMAGALVGELTDDGLRRALAAATAGLLREAGDLPVVEKVRPKLAELLGADAT